MFYKDATVRIHKAFITFLQLEKAQIPQRHLTEVHHSLLLLDYGQFCSSSNAFSGKKKKKKKSADFSFTSICWNGLARCLLYPKAGHPA